MNITFRAFGCVFGFSSFSITKTSFPNSWAIEKFGWHLVRTSMGVYPFNAGVELRFPTYKACKTASHHRDKGYFFSINMARTKSKSVRLILLRMPFCCGKCGADGLNSVSLSSNQFQVPSYSAVLSALISFGQHPCCVWVRSDAKKFRYGQAGHLDLFSSSNNFWFLDSLLIWKSVMNLLIGRFSKLLSCIGRVDFDEDKLSKLRSFKCTKLWMCELITKRQIR